MPVLVGLRVEDVFVGLVLTPNIEIGDPGVALIGVGDLGVELEKLGIGVKAVIYVTII